MFVLFSIQDLDPWVTAPLFEDECNAMDSIGAMVVGRPPFAGGSDGSIGSSNGLRDCPSPPRGRPGDGPLDRLCESWEGDQVTVTSADVLASAAADAASTQEYARSYEGLAAAGHQEEVPEAACVGGLADPSAGLSASAPAMSIGFTQAIVVSAEGNKPAPNARPRPASATPPPVPTKPASVTTAFLFKESSTSGDPLAYWDSSNEGGVGGTAGVAHAGAPGTVSSQDLLLEWLRREAADGDEEAQFHLAQLFSPPRFEMKGECRECGEPFGVTRYRHHCRHCGGSFCHEHAWHEHPIPKLGLPAPQVRELCCASWRTAVHLSFAGTW